MTQYGDFIVHPRRRTDARLKTFLLRDVDALLSHLKHKGRRPKITWLLNQENHLFWENGQAWESKKVRNYISAWKFDI